MSNIYMNDLSEARTYPPIKRNTRRYQNKNEADSILKTPDGMLVRCLYVTNVPAVVDRDVLFYFFSKYGTVKLLRFTEKHNHVKKSTFAFVTYETPEEAYGLYMKRYFLMLMDFKLYVNIADSWHQPTVLRDGTIIYDPAKQAQIEKKVTANPLLLTPKKSLTEEDDCSDIEEESDVNTVEDCPIYKLNDDCLRHIFDFIPFDQRYVISHVCRRWRNLMESFWSKFRCLDFSDVPFVNVDNPYVCFGMYLRLCPNISTVNLINFPNSFSNETFTSQSIVQAASYCPNMEELIINGIELDIRPLASVAHFCENLKTFTMINCKFKDRDSELTPMMKKCKKLESLKFVKCVFNPGNWLKYLRPGIKLLHFSECSFNNDLLYLGLLNLRESLESFLCIVDFLGDPLDLNYLHKFSKLQNFTYVCFREQPSRYFPCFERLNSLQIECNNIITDILLKELVHASPDLTVLNLSNSHETLQSDGLRVIINLPNLIKLNLSKTLVDDDFLIALADKNKNLEVISLISCNITDDGCKSLVQNLTKLRELYLCSCTSVTNKTVEASVEAASLNLQKPKLTIYIEGSGIKEVQTKPHERVELSFNSCNWSWISLDPDLSNRSFLLDVDEDDDDDIHGFDFEFDDHDMEDFIFGFRNNYDYDSDDYELDYEDINDHEDYDIFYDHLF